MRKEKYLMASLLFFLAIAFAAIPVEAKKPSEYDSIVAHLKTKYRAKKVKVPFLWLARFAVSVVKPAGVERLNSLAAGVAEHVAASGLAAKLQS